MGAEKELRECFKAAEKQESKGMKHKGLLAVKPSAQSAKEYIGKAKEGLRYCEFYREMGADYKIPEEWFYSLYYCGLAILSKFGVETRNQKCTAIFLRYVRDKGLIDYDSDFIDRITVHKEKDKKSNVDEREAARYSPQIKIKEVEKQYDEMMGVCKKAISQCEEIVFSAKDLKIPEELLK